jgi:DNA-binding response OmpR family regulator
MSVSVLIVDDDPSVLMVVAATCIREGYIVCACADPLQAERICECMRFNFLVADYDMPGLNGVLLIDRVKEKRQADVALLYTGQIDVTRTVHCDALVSKGEGPEVLLAAIAYHLRPAQR